MTFDVNSKFEFRLGGRLRWSVGQFLLLWCGLDKLLLPLAFNFRHFGLCGGKGLFECNSLYRGSLGTLPNEGDLFLNVFRLGRRDLLNVSRGFWNGIELLLVLLLNPSGARRSGFFLDEVLKGNCVCKVNKQLLNSKN